MAKKSAFGKGRIQFDEKGKYRIELSGGRDPRTGIVYHVDSADHVQDVVYLPVDEIPDNAVAVVSLAGDGKLRWKPVSPKLKFEDADEAQRGAHYWRTPDEYLRARETFLGTKRGAELRVEQMRRELDLLRGVLELGLDPNDLQAHGLGIEQAAHDGMSAGDLKRELDRINMELARTATFDEWCEQYLANREKMGERRTSTLMKDRSHSVHLLRYLSGKHLNEISPATVRGMYADMRAAGAGDETLFSCHSLMRRIMEDAYENDRIDRNPMDKVKKPERTQNVKCVWLELDEMQRLAGIITTGKPTAYKTAVYIALAGGLRLGEVLGLQWQHLHVDGEVPYLDVEQQLNRYGKVSPLKTAKYGKTTMGRVCTLDGSTVDALMAWKSQQRVDLNELGIEQSSTTPIVTNIVGNWVTHSNLERWFRSFCVRNGFGKFYTDDGREIVELEVGEPLAGLYDGDGYLVLWHDSDGWPCTPDGIRYSRTNPNPNKDVKRHYDGLRFHGLRHTHFSILEGEGVPRSTSRARGGWKDDRMLNRYAHPLEGNIWAPVNFMDRHAPKAKQPILHAE